MGKIESSVTHGELLRGHPLDHNKQQHIEECSWKGLNCANLLKLRSETNKMEDPEEQEADKNAWEGEGHRSWEDLEEVFLVLWIGNSSLLSAG